MHEKDFSFWEFDPFQDRVYEQIQIPARPDSGWCDLVSEYYGKGYFRAKLKSSAFIRERIVPVGSIKSRYFCAPECPVNNQGQAATRDLIGVFAGLELRPDHMAPDYSHELYANLLNVADAETGEIITGPNDVGLLIPVLEPVIKLVQY